MTLFPRGFPLFGGELLSEQSPVALATFCSWDVALLSTPLHCHCVCTTMTTNDHQPQAPTPAASQSGCRQCVDPSAMVASSPVGQALFTLIQNLCVCSAGHGGYRDLSLGVSVLTTTERR